MSDQKELAADPTVELTAEPEAAKGGLIKGADGKLSGRKLLGLAGFPAGIGLGAWAIQRGLPWGVVLVALGVPLAFSLIMYGILTMQNIQGIIASWRGGITG